MHQSFQKGWTLIECLITMAITALTLSVAIPSIHQTIQNVSKANATQIIFHHIQYAKSEAIKRNQVMAVCGSFDGQTCDGGWPSHLLVQNAITHEILRTYAFKHPIDIALFSSVSQNAFQFAPTGRALARGHFEIKSDTQLDKIIIYNSGRARIETQFLG